jgi:hypothetical protein
MDFTSIKTGLTGSIKRFPPRRRARTIGVLRRAIEPRFTDWIRGHWQFGGTRLFSAVPLNFLRPASPFGQISWPQRHETASSVVMAPTINLSLQLAPITNVFFGGNTSPASFSQSSAVATSNFARIDLRNNTYNRSLSQTAGRQAAAAPAAPLTREDWSTFFRFNNLLREVSGQRGASTFRTSERFAGPRTNTFLSGPFVSTSNTTNRPLLTTVLSAVRQFTQSLESNLVQHIRERQAAGDVYDRGKPVAEHLLREWTGTTLSLTRVLKSAVEFHASRADTREWSRLNETVTSASHSFLTLVKNAKSSSASASRVRSTADVSQRFGVSQPSGPDAIARQIQYFGSAPNLSYVKRESPQIQQLVSPLKEARPAETPVRTPAPEFPSVAQLTTHVRQELERELRIERERRGL